MTSPTAIGRSYSAMSDGGNCLRGDVLGELSRACDDRLASASGEQTQWNSTIVACGGRWSPQDPNPELHYTGHLGSRASRGSHRPPWTAAAVHERPALTGRDLVQIVGATRNRDREQCAEEPATVPVITGLPHPGLLASCDLEEES